MISKADANCTVNSYTGIYDSAAHGATGSCTGVGGENPGTLVLGDSFINVSGGTAHWTFTGNGNYNDKSGNVAIDISKADATCTIDGWTGTYDATAHGASGSCTGVGGISDVLSGLNLGATYTNVPGGTAHWIFAGGTNYNDQSGDVSIDISKADASVTVNGYTGIYDGNAHGATGTAKGIGGVDLTGLDLGSTFTDVPGGTANWVFTDVTGNYNNKSDDVAVVITKADPTIVVTPYDVTYDGNAHIATYTAKGVKSEDLTGMDVSGTTRTAAGDYPSDAWTFIDSTGNYKDTSGTVHDKIAKADATCTVNGYSNVYDAAPHGASGACTGVGGTNLNSSLNLGDSFTDVPGGTAHWTFTGGTNYNDQSGDVAITISKADATVTVNGYTGIYDGNAHGATGTVTGVGGVDLSASLNPGSSFTNVPGGTANWAFTGGTNYLDESGNAAIVISKANPTIVVTQYNLTYDGNEHTATSTITGVKGEALSGLDVSGTTHTNAGDYPVDAWTFTDATGNYSNSAGTVHDVINKKSSSVTPDTSTKVYGSVDPTLSGTLDGFLTSDGVTADYTRTAGETVLGGPYTISATLNPAGILGNYDITYNTASFSITAKPITVTADAKSKVFGDSDPTLTYVSSDLGVTFTGSLSRVTGENAGTYAIGQNDLSTGTNYAITYVGANLTITQADQAITVTTHAPASATNGSSFTVAATGGGSGNSVTYSSGTPSVSTNVGATFTMNSNTTGSCAVQYNQAGNSNYNAATQVTESTETLLTISSETTSSVTSTSTTITWTTDHDATSRVIYDTVSHDPANPTLDIPFDKYGYANTTDEFDASPKVTSHSVAISGLTAGTTYYYRTVSHGSPEAVSDEHTFGTTTTSTTGGGGGGDGLSDGRSDGKSDGRSDGMSSPPVANVLGISSLAYGGTGEEALGAQTQNGASGSALTPTPTPQTGEVLAGKTTGNPWWSWIGSLFAFITHRLFFWWK